MKVGSRTQALKTEVMDKLNKLICSEGQRLKWLYLLTMFCFFISSLWSIPLSSDSETNFPSIIKSSFTIYSIRIYSQRLANANIITETDIKTRTQHLKKKKNMPPAKAVILVWNFFKASAEPKANFWALKKQIILICCLNYFHIPLPLLVLSVNISGKTQLKHHTKVCSYHMSS